MIRTPEHVARRPDTGGGFSLIELIAVLVVAGIMAAVAVPTLTTLASARAAAAVKVAVRDLSFARERATTSGMRTWAVFDVAGNAYSLLQEPIGSPGRSRAMAIPDPATQRDFRQVLGAGEFAGVKLTAANFDGKPEVGFDWLGRPLNSAEKSLSATGSVTLGGMSVTVEVGSGLVRAP